MENKSPSLDQTKTQNMARALYDSGYSQNYVLEAIQSKGFSNEDAIAINYSAYKELHLEKRRTFRIVFWVTGILMVVFLGLGIYFEIQESQMAQTQIENGSATSMGNNLYVVHGNFDQNKTALKGGALAGIIFLLNIIRYYFSVLPRFKGIIKPQASNFK